MAAQFNPSDQATYQLSAEDKLRLERFAQLYSVPVIHAPDGRLQLTVATRIGTRHLELPADIAHMRLLAELCSLSARWLYFNPKEHCAVTLLSQSDARIARLAHLHAQGFAQAAP